MRQVKHQITLGQRDLRHAPDPALANAEGRAANHRRISDRAVFGGCAGLLALAMACGSNTAQRPAQSAGEEATSSETSSSSGSGKMTPPGECIDPIVDGDKRDGTRPFDKHVQADVRSEDLDGDGEPDAFVKPAWSCGSSCYHSAYVVRGTCAHYVGTFLTTERYESMEASTNGLKDLMTRPSRKSESDGEWHCYQVVLKFDGKEYKPARERECECKDEGAKCTAWGN